MCLGGHLCFPLLRKSCCVKVVNVAEPSAIVYLKVTNVTTTRANLARGLFLFFADVDLLKATVFFLGFFSSPGK